MKSLARLICFGLVLSCLAAVQAIAADTAFVPRARYLDLMERAVSAYTSEHMERYLKDVQRGGLAEHGFPRLCSNLGTLLAHGRPMCYCGQLDHQLANL